MVWLWPMMPSLIPGNMKVELTIMVIIIPVFRCSASHANEMVVAIVNKQWIKNGIGGGNAYHPVSNLMK